MGAERTSSGGTAFVGTHRVENRDAGVGRAGDRSFAAAAAEQLTKGGLIVFGGLSVVYEALDDVDEAGVVLPRSFVSSAIDRLR